MSTGTFIKTNWVGIVGACLGFLGISFSIHFYKQSQAIRAPVFAVSPSRTRIVVAKNVIETPFSVVRKSGEQIKGDISSVWLYFWNQGRLPIKSINILAPIVVSLMDSQGEILDFKLIAQSRDIINAQVTRCESDKRNSLTFTFDILEELDGFTVQVIYVGEPTTGFSIEGVIEGVRGAISDEAFRKELLWRSYGSKLKGFIFALLLVFIFMLLPELFNYIRIKFGKRFEKAFNYLRICFSIILIISVLFVLTKVIIIDPIKDAKKEAFLKLDQMVPAALRVQVESGEQKTPTPTQ